MTDGRSGAGVVDQSRVDRSWVAPPRLRGVARSARGDGPRRSVPQSAVPRAVCRDRARSPRRVAVGEGAAGPRPVRGGCAAPAGRSTGVPVPRRAEVAGRPAAGLRLTRRGRRLVAGLSLAAGIGIALVAATTVVGDERGGLQPVGDSSVVVRSGDTLWSIAVAVAPEEDTREVVDAIVEVNDLEGVGLVPGQVLQLP